MGIRLEVKDYCSDCPGFEAKVKVNDFGETLGALTEIRCVHEKRCSAIARYITEKVHNENEDNKRVEDCTTCRWTNDARCMDCRHKTGSMHGWNHWCSKDAK